MNLVVLGLSLTSSWGNGHATTYRALLREFAARGHRVTFLERNTPWYARHRDLAQAPYARIELYDSLDELQDCHAALVRQADAVIVGSYVPDGIDVCDWVLRTAHGVTAFYDIDTPITLDAVADGTCAYLAAADIPRFSLYLSFTSGPVLHRLETELGSPCARPLLCSVDPTVYRPQPRQARWRLGYLGTHSADRQPGLERLLLTPARALPTEDFVVAGAGYPESAEWPPNVTHHEHVPPAEHCDFYNDQQFTLNLTRAAMRRIGHSPSVRLFEAAACGTPIISDHWTGLEEFFHPGRDIFIADNAEDVIRLLRDTPLERALLVGESGRRRVLERHTAAHRAAELEFRLAEARRPAPPPPELAAPPADRHHSSPVASLGR